MSNKVRSIHPNFIDKHQPPIRVQTLLEGKLTEQLINELLESASTPNPIRIGIAPAYSSSDQLLAVAIATELNVLVLQLQKSKGDTMGRGRELLLTKVLCNPDCTLYCFDIALLAISLHKDHDMRILNGVDVESVCCGSDEGARVSPLAAVEFAVGDKWPIYKENVVAAFRDKAWDPKPAGHTSMALKAWLASFLPTIPDMEERFNAAKRVNTKDKSEIALTEIARIARADQRSASQRPVVSANEFSAPLANQQTVKVRSDRFQTRIQKYSDVRLTVRDESGAEYQIHGRAADIKGRSASIKASASLEGKTITSISSSDNGRATNAENQKADFVLRVLWGEVDLFENPFRKYIWSPGDDFTWPEDFESSDEVPSIIAPQLNDSQHRAVTCMLSLANSTRLTVIQGPPGTGKTSVIAAFVCSAISGGRKGIWLVAQTNVAVKNIAEKLFKEKFMNWRLLVSTDFHMEWHEHLYQQINKNIIRSDLFSDASRYMKGCSVILCTLSMLSNPRIKIFTRFVPLTTLVVDEASQISINDYIPALQGFPSLRKMCFVGDNKQLPPFQQDSNEDLKSIFEVPHLRCDALMLNIQYRMPPHIGDFISEAMYDAQLASNPEHPVKVSETYFVDTGEDSCEKRNNTSWMNHTECQAVLKIAASLQGEGKAYRIITPYDAQRSLIETSMKKIGLHWQDKCFNVDSFQGNEEDYIIISLVRSKDLGFLDDFRRTNVMLTRCKRGMYICTTWEFVWVQAANTLVGQMAAAWGAEAWKPIDDWADLEEEEA